MVHHFKFKYNKKYFYFLWDIESGSLHSLDEAAFLIYKKIFATLISSKEADRYNGLSKDLIEEVLKDFETLKENGLLFSEPKIINFKKSIKNIKALCLHICHDCNLACKYCFAKEGTYSKEKEYMSLEVGKKSVEFLIENSGNIKNLEIDFFGGEPLLNFPTIKDIVIYAKHLAEINNKHIIFTLTTNCLNLDKSNIDFINKEMGNVVLSIDGRKEVHNIMRTSKNEKGSYDIVLKNALQFKNLRQEKKYYARGTFTTENLDFCKDVLHLNDLGFNQISIEPVVLPESHPLSIQKGHLKTIFNEYDHLAEKYLSYRKEGKWFNFFHYMLDLEEGPCINKRLTGCGAGAEYLAISPSGEIFPCHQFVGKEEYSLGDVYLGLKNQKLRETFADNTVTNKEHCKNCFAKYYCGGGCIANALNSTGKIDGQYVIGCEMTKKRFENSLAIWAIENMNIL